MKKKEMLLEQMEFPLKRPRGRPPTLRPKTERQRAKTYYERQREKGLVMFRAYLTPEEVQQVQALLAQKRQA